MKDIFGTLGVVALVLFIPFIAFFCKFEVSEDLVSGIVYNNTNNALISGNTNFNVRASVDTYVNEKNTSAYCLPRGSQYIPIIEKAAADKSVQVVVRTKTGFWVKLPWTCIDNVVVEEKK